MQSVKWLNYLIEALGLGTFMVSAGLFGTLLYAPASPVFSLISNDLTRGILMGLAMGLTAIAIIYSPPGKRSGAHINPAVTLTFHYLKKIQTIDAIFYIIAQFIGGLAGVWLVAGLLGPVFTTPPVNYVVTLPGSNGVFTAFWVEFMLSFGLMAMILITSNIKSLSNLTGLFSGVMLSFYIPFAVPLSGMSINPARTLASAWPAQQWTSLWIYFVAPPLAMLCVAMLYRHCSSLNTREMCCKLCPNSTTPCISHRCCQHCGDRLSNDLLSLD
ncbi:aquaporin [filamentous cyanobacterium LEGE 11480]|uniref:Aquaporin n=1 Tax=Romeriopsis navalis LEGE 11480 TaxID=2777977 RepID=A0A928Z1P6_9CYAN|nr:aquaporin [Romeriopsis navalis]MBE9028714.1 aquaporin [Romeriopsis navalis LEGE 11480]